MSSLGHRLIHGWSPSLSGAQLCPQGARLKGDPVMDSEARVAEENRRAREVVTAAKLLLKSDPGRRRGPRREHPYARARTHPPLYLALCAVALAASLRREDTDRGGRVRPRP